MILFFPIQIHDIIIKNVTLHVCVCLKINYFSFRKCGKLLLFFCLFFFYFRLICSRNLYLHGTPIQCFLVRHFLKKYWIHLWPRWNRKIFVLLAHLNFIKYLKNISYSFTKWSTTKKNNYLIFLVCWNSNQVGQLKFKFNSIKFANIFPHQWILTQPELNFFFHRLMP